MTRILLRAPKSPFVPVRAYMGGNSGNLVFIDAAWKLLSTHDAEIEADGFAPHEIGADVINERYDVYVIPMANAFRDSYQVYLAQYADVIERLKIPVVMLSGGLQSPLPYASGMSRPFDKSVTRFVRAVMDRSGSIGVRGEYSHDYVKSLGFSDVHVIGCPSMFMYGDQLSVTRKRPTLERDSRIAFNVTSRVGEMGPVIEANMRRYPKLEYIAQDKDAIRLLLDGKGSKRIPDPSPMPVHRSHPLMRGDRTSFFLDPWPWIDHLRKMDFVFGTRIHGNIVAFLAGTPAYVIAHDTRTLELARHFEIPHRTAAAVTPDMDPKDLYADADYGPLVANHASRFRTYIDYVESHGLKHVFQPGEDPEGFDRRIASITFPPAIHVRNNGRLHLAQRRVRRKLRRVLGRDTKKG